MSFFRKIYGESAMLPFDSYEQQAIRSSKEASHGQKGE